MLQYEISCPVLQPLQRRPPRAGDTPSHTEKGASLQPEGGLGVRTSCQRALTAL